MLIYSEIVQPKSKWPDFKVCAQAFMLYIQSFSTCLLEFNSLMMSCKAVATSGLKVFISRSLTWPASLHLLEACAWCSWKAARPGSAMASTKRLEVCSPWTCVLFHKWSSVCGSRRCPSEWQSAWIWLPRRPEVCGGFCAESYRRPRGQCLPL